MEMFLPTLMLTLIVLTLAIAGISIKSFFKKDGQFNGSCAQNNPLLKNDIGECTVCGKVPEEACETNSGGSLPPIKPA